MRPPDWKSPSEYPNPESTTDIEWAWQFLRRNHHYQADWQLELCVHEHNGGDVRPTFITLPEFQITPGTDDKSKGKDYYLEAYGLYSLPNPEQAAPIKPMFEPRFGEFRFAQAMEQIKLTLLDGQAVFIFDLTLPLRPQLIAVRSKLEEAAKDKGVLAKKKYQRRNLFTTYLRLLDAEQTDAPVKEIAAQIFPTISNVDPDYNGNKRVIDGLLAAKLLRDSGYRSLTFGWILSEK